MHLHCPVDHAREDVRRVELDQRDLDARIPFLVDLVRGVERQQAASLDLGGRVGDPVLHGLLLGERPAERLALERACAHQLERALHLSRASASRGGSGRGRAASARSESRRPARRGDSPPARVRRRRSPRSASSSRGRGVRASAPARSSTPGRVGRDDDLAHAPSRLGVGLGDRHDDPERRALGAGREPLAAVDHPLVAVEHRGRLQTRWDRHPDTSGSVIEKNDRTSPATSGFSQRSCCSGVPNWWRISPLPASGAWQLKTYCAQRDAPDLLVQVGVGEEALARCRPPRAAGAAPTVPRPSHARAARGATLGCIGLVRVPPRADSRAPLTGSIGARR